MQQPFKVGITGGIGSGKSVVCRLFHLLGIPVFDADTEAKRLMMVDPQLVSAIRGAFGADVYGENGVLNRSYLAAQVFGNEKQLARLNALVHPVVIQAGEEWASKQQHVPYVVKEAALLFESGSFKLNDYNVLVTAPITVRIERVVKRDHISAAQVEARMERQWPDEKKKALADGVVINDGTQALIPQVLKLDQFFRTQQQ